MDSRAPPPGTPLFTPAAYGRQSSAVVPPSALRQKSAASPKQSRRNVSSSPLTPTPSEMSPIIGAPRARTPYDAHRPVTPSPLQRSVPLAPPTVSEISHLGGEVRENEMHLGEGQVAGQKDKAPRAMEETSVVEGNTSSVEKEHFGERGRNIEPPVAGRHRWMTSLSLLLALAAGLREQVHLLDDHVESATLDLIENYIGEISRLLPIALKEGTRARHVLERQMSTATDALCQLRRRPLNPTRPLPHHSHARTHGSAATSST